MSGNVTIAFPVNRSTPKKYYRYCCSDLRLTIAVVSAFSTTSSSSPFYDRDSVWNLLFLSDRTGGLTANEVRGAYQLTGSKDQSAYIRLRLTRVDPSDRNQLSAGTSVVVMLPKKVNVLSAMFGS